MAKADKIEIFCSELMKGKSQRQAYYAAYPSSKKWKDYVVDNKASEFANSGEVLVRLRELREHSRERFEITQEMIVNELCKLGFAQIDAGLLKPSDKLKALELTARMLGLDRPMDSGEAEDLSEAEGDIFG